MRESAQKYANIHNMNKSQKIEALKDLSIDPRGLVDPYDGLATVSYGWTQVGAAAIAHGMDSSTKQKMASEYYDQMVAPAYQRLGRPPISKDLWMKEAYDEGLKYKLEDSYHSSLVQGFINGDGTGTAALARATQFLTDVFGYGNKVVADRITKEGFSWTDEYEALMAGRRKTGSFMGGVEERIKTAPALGAIGRVLGIPDTKAFHTASTFLGENADKLQFQSDITPNKGVIEKSTSFVTEQALMTPLYMGAGESAALISKGVVAAAPETLTAFLELSPKGKAAVSLLKAGGEGGLVGVTVRPNDEKADAWQDALAWMAMHTMFLVGTKGTGKTSMKLGEILQGKSKAKFDRLDEEYRLHSIGLRSQSSAEVQHQAEEVVANTTLAAGVHTPYFHYQQAEHMLRKAASEGLTEKELVKNTNVLLKHDPAYWSGPIAAMKHIRSLLGDTDITSVEPWSEEHQALWGQIHDTISNAATHMNTYVAPLQESAAEEAYKEASTTPAGKIALDKIKQEIKMDWETSGHAPMTDEQYGKMAEQKYKESVKYQTVEAEANRKEPVVKASEAKAEADKIDLAKRRAVNEAAGVMRKRESFFTDAKGRRIGYSLSYSKSYNVYALEKGGRSTTLKGASFNAYLTKYLKDLSPKDFSEDLNDYWLPKLMQEEGISFETETTEEGKENPNLLAFAWNFKDAMPAPLKKELEERLAGQPKLQQAIGKTMKPHHLDYFAETMLAHVDEFFRARTLLKDQYKIWRSTASENMMRPTVFQLRLQQQVDKLEEAEVKASCAGNKSLEKDVIRLLRKLQSGRRAATMKGIKSPSSSAKRLAFSEEIQELLGHPEKWKEVE